MITVCSDRSSICGHSLSCNAPEDDAVGQGVSAEVVVSVNAAHKLTGSAETGNRFSVDFDDLCMLHYRRLATLTGQTKMKGPIVGCERVSSFDQNLARRLQQIKVEDTDKIVDDKASGANTNWPTFQQMMKYVRWGKHRCA